MLGKKKASKKLDAAVLAINSMLAQIYKNKSTDEYKMKGDITRSPSYKQLEEMVADLKTLKGYSPSDANDMAKLFNTLHRPIFKTMVKEYITDPNDRNTVFTSMFTIGYRLLVGELARIFAATEATPKGIVYKPNKMSRKEDASKLIKLFNDDLEQKLNTFIQSMKKHPEDSPVSEAYLTMVINSLIQEADEVSSDDTSSGGDDSSNVDTVEEADDTTAPDTVEEEAEGTTAVVGADPDPVEECSKIKTVKETAPGSGPGENDPGAAMEDNDSTNAGNTVTESATIFMEEDERPQWVQNLEKKAANIEGVSKLGALVIGSVAIIGGLFSSVVGLLKGFNPIADINYMYMNSYDNTVAQLGNVATMYEATKKAYEDYMKIPEAQRKKKVESKYLKDMEKYNIAMNNLSAKIEHFNSRAKKESQEVVADIEKQIPSDKVPQGGDPGNTVNNDDDDFQF